ncbi:MAG: aldose 1-epimerase family protein [Anaerolineae bacterium]|nr:aldose 1-epimerase family protein [Anaerolineae bacterium]
MPQLFDRDYTPDELARLIGDMTQLAGVRLGELSDGVARGVRIADFHTATGLAFTVLLDRGMDIGAARFAGRPLAWESPVGWAHPSRYEPGELGWLYTFGGGLMTGCGLAWFGAPTVDQGVPLGLHGRLSHTPAANVSAGAQWEDGEYVIWVQGEVREAKVHGDTLRLTRCISTVLDGTWLLIDDRVENLGFTPAPHMMLYHCNFGFPVVSPDTELVVDDANVAPRDDVAAPGLDEHTRFGNPTPGYAEQVFYHSVNPDDDGSAYAALINRALNFGAYVRYRQAELPCLVQWKHTGAGQYVCGLEPATAWVGGRDTARAEGQLKVLEPGEAVEYEVEIGVLPDAEAIEEYEG